MESDDDDSFESDFSGSSVKREVEDGDGSVRVDERVITSGDECIDGFSKLRGRFIEIFVIFT